MHIHFPCTLYSSYRVYMILHVLGMHELHGRMHQLGLCNCFVGCHGPTHPSRPTISSTTSALRYGPLKFSLLSNSQQMYMHTCTCTLSPCTGISKACQEHVQYMIILARPTSSRSYHALLNLRAFQRNKRKF